MSWDVAFFADPGPGVRTLTDLPQDWNPPPLGSGEEVRRAIDAAVSEPVDWSDPAWGVLNTERVLVEFSVGDQEPVESVTLHVRAGTDPESLIRELSRGCGWRAYDCSTGEFRDPSGAGESGYGAWRAYRDRVIGEKAP